MIRETFTYYDQANWQRYWIEYAADKPPNAATLVTIGESGPHTFGRVPLLRLDVTDGLWAMAKILPIAKAHFNLRCALGWTELKSLFPILAVFIGGQMPLNPITEDPNRAQHQRYGQGQLATFGENDKLEYVSPDEGPFDAAMKDLETLSDEMHRVLHQMAMARKNTAAAQQQSAESKKQDAAPTTIVLGALADLIRCHAVELYEMAAKGRKEATVIEWSSEGLDSFDDQSTADLVEQAGTVDTVSIPSATFKRIWASNLARRLLGNNATPEDLETIYEELKMAISNEDYMAPLTPLDVEDDDLEEDEDEEPDGNKA